ncbi:MAG: starch-binding protein [Muribaculaceae bacterium]|nr:starch-binding protein [Muribaculaceae bacterium]
MTITKIKNLLCCLGMVVLPFAFSSETFATDLPERIEDGNILHCFNWSIQEVKENLPNIAEAGFVAVQLSPMQRPSAKRGDSWSDLYRPYDLSFQESEAMGSLEDLKNLCAAANELGIKVIVDVVANHIDREDGFHLEWWEQGTQARIRKDAGPISYSNRTSITTGLIGDYAYEINTEATAVLQKAKKYVTDLASYGVSGIRWDAAKHIGLPSEDSNFWSTVTTAVDGMYHYGEILDNPCSSNYGDIVKEYAQYIAVTDTYFSNEAAQSNNGIAKRKNGEYAPLVGKDKLIYWAESHDTYSNTTQFGGWSNSKDQSVINRAYAAMACRDGAVALYLARPGSSGFNNIKLGKSSTEEQDKAGFRSEVVKQVNAFRNAMTGREEFFTKSEDAKAVCITRNNGGAVIITEPNASFTVPNGGSYCPVINGIMKDKISGNNITVTTETLSGKAGDTGVVVIYTTSLSAKPGVTIQDYDPIDITIYYDNSTTKWNQVLCHYWGGSQETGFPGVAMNKVDNDSYDRDLYSITVPYGSNVLFAANNSTQTVNQKNVEANHVYKGLAEMEGTKHLVFDSGIFGDEPLEPEEDDSKFVTVYYDNSITQYSIPCCHYWGGSETTTFPGKEMDKVMDNIYKITFPSDNSGMLFADKDKSAQTGNVTDISNGYLYKGDKKENRTGVTKVGEYNEENNGDGQDTKDTITIYYDNSLTKYEEPVSCYYYATNLNPVKFPGVAMTPLGNDIYKVEIPTGEWTLIFDNGINSGDNARQTENSHSTGKDGYIYQGQEETNTRNRNLLDDGKPYEENRVEDPIKEITVYVNSSTVPYLYVWNGNEKLNGNFPGNQMEESSLVTIGDNRYFSQTFTGYEIINVILTNEDRVQTSNIENISEDIFINWSGDNRYEIIEDPEGELNSWTPMAMVTVYYDNSLTLWDYVNCYTYGNGGEYLGGFPGQAMNLVDDEKNPNIFSIEVPEGNSVIFNFEGDANQTVDIDNVGEGELFIGFESKNETGKYDVTRSTWNDSEEKEDETEKEEPEEGPKDEPVEEPKDEPEEETEFITIYYDDVYTNYSLTGNIGKVNCYYYKEGQTYTEWPGEEMEKVVESTVESYSFRSEGDPVLFKIEIPKDCNGVVFNDGAKEFGLQTIEINQEDLMHNRIYIGTLEVDEENNHLVIIGNIYSDNTSGIQDMITPTNSKDLFYDLQGFPTSNPQKGRIYIKSGKKILVL